MTNNVFSRDAIATWFLDPEMGGRYLQPRRDLRGNGPQSPEVEFVGILSDLPARHDVVPRPFINAGNLGLYLVAGVGLQAFMTDLSQAGAPAAMQPGAGRTGFTALPDPEASTKGNAMLEPTNALDPSKDPALIVPLPLTSAQVLRQDLPTVQQSRDDIPETLSDARVIHAVIDDTILPIHHHTRREDGSTRYAAIWHQDGPAVNNHTHGFGRVWYRPEIDRLLKLDPASIRRAFGHDVGRATGLPTGAIAMSHGGAVVDLFSGYNPRPDMFEDSGSSVPDHPIIGVQLPAQVFWDSAGLALGFFISTALDFIFDTAERMGGGKVPLVINLSYGMTAGPHDGTSFIERVIDNQLAARRKRAPTELVLPIGNDHLARRSWRQTTNAASFVIEVPPHRIRPTLVETWLSWNKSGPEADRQALISLTGPDNVEYLSVRMRPGEHRDLQGADGRAFGRVAFENNPNAAEPGRRLRVSLMLAPTYHPSRTFLTTRSGRWVLNITTDAEQGFESWIQRDDDPVGFPACCSAVRFRYPDQIEELRQRRFTATAKVTGKNSIICAGWRLSDGRLAPYSAAYDPKSNPARSAESPQQFVFAAPSDSSAVLPGLRAAGNLGGRAGAISGTSAAAPVLARLLADMLAKDPEISPVGEALKNIVKPDGKVGPPKQLVPGDPHCRPGQVSLSDWLGTTRGDPDGKAWTGEPAEYSQSRIGQGLIAPTGMALTRIRRK